MNRKASLLLGAIKHHHQQYPEVFVVDVEKIVKDTYGEVAVWKDRAPQKLTTYAAEDQLEFTYRNQAALTVSLMVFWPKRA
jgi:hypothetical protein